MADREIHTNDNGSGGMGAILGMIVGVLLVGGLIFYFAGNWSADDARVTANSPSAPATTGSSAPSAPPAPANPAR
jgi:hypothetical protein